MTAHLSKVSDTITTSESRGGIILRQYWESLLKGRAFPQERDIESDKLAGVWDSCFLISIDDVTQREGYRYSYLGKKLIEAYGDDIHNPEVIIRLLATNNLDGLSLKENIDRVVETKQPVIDEAEFVNLKRLNVKYRVSLFPLGTDGVLTHILGCMRWRMY